MLIATSRERAKGPAYYRRAAFLFNRNRKLDGLQIRSRQFATLAHDVVADPLALIEAAQLRVHNTLANTKNISGS
jgi:hypothetical protein